MKHTLIEYLSQFITENKRQLIDKVLESRTRHLTIVVEDIYQPHNASAVVRTCDCFGIQDLHIIENRNKYTVNPDVTLGSSKWVDIIKYSHSNSNNTELCLRDLKAKGYKILATSPHKNDVDIEELPLHDKMALIFGNEKDGLSEDVMKMADGFVKIPMYGFTESLNISVSAAICIHEIISRLRNSDVDWRLSLQEKEDIKLGWIKTIIKNADLLEQEYYNRNQQ
ncbi:MAG: RNA methyltransferase [Cytophagaceae bacterium]|nr:RNA methyltransferase [Cytophagaceae bacterium]